MPSDAAESANSTDLRHEKCKTNLANLHRLCMMTKNNFALFAEERDRTRVIEFTRCSQLQTTRGHVVLSFQCRKNDSMVIGQDACACTAVNRRNRALRFESGTANWFAGRLPRRRRSGLARDERSPTSPSPHGWRLQGPWQFMRGDLTWKPPKRQGLESAPKASLGSTQFSARNS